MLAGGYRGTRNLLPTHQNVGLAFSSFKSCVFARLGATFLLWVTKEYIITYSWTGSDITDF
jgi:hypothetical protein